jgi:hypothetical protein
MLAASQANSSTQKYQHAPPAPMKPHVRIRYPYHELLRDCQDVPSAPMKPTVRHRDPLRDATDGDSLIVHSTEIVEIPHVPIVPEERPGSRDYYKAPPYYPDTTPPCLLADLPQGLRTREALRQALIADCTADPRTGQPGTFADLLEWIQLANFPNLPPASKQQVVRAICPTSALPGRMKAVQLVLDKHRLEAAVCQEVFRNPPEMERYMVLFTAELRLVQKLLWARCCADEDNGNESGEAHLEYTYSLMSMFWRGMIEALDFPYRVAVEEGAPDAYDPTCATMPAQNTATKRVLHSCLRTNQNWARPPSTSTLTSTRHPLIKQMRGASGLSLLFRICCVM